MRFMVMHKVTARMETGAPPEAAVIERVHALISEAARSGAFVDGEGLQPTRTRAHLVYRGGERTITSGPFDGLRELVAGFALLAVRSKDEAIACCDRYAAAAGDVSFVLGPVVEPWDLGMGERPDDAPLRFLALRLADARTEADAPLEPARAARISAVTAESTASGTLRASGALASTKHGARVRLERGKKKARVLDGPFAESKELVAGYAILELPSKAAAIEWAIRFGEIVEVDEVDVRLLAQ